MSKKAISTSTIPAKNPKPGTSKPKASGSGKKKSADDAPPIRIRAHVIADLSVNHVEYGVIFSGHTLDVQKADYGYDGMISTFNSTGEVENGLCLLQLKATDHIAGMLVEKGTQIAYPLGKGHIRLWENELSPVYLIIFDALKEVGYWLDLQNYLQKKKINSAAITGKTKTIHIPLSNIFDPSTPEIWRQEKATRQAKIKAALAGTP